MWTPALGRLEEKMNKKLLISIILFLCSFFCFAQIINSDYFPKDNEIDKQFEIDMQKFVTNYEWQVLIGKYIDLWKTQMNLEMERLISIIPESENEIRENQKKWEEVVQDDYKLVYDNVDVNFVGREIYIGEFTGGKISLYRERAKYYLCLYYKILDQTSEDYCYTDKNGTHLAR